MLELFVLSRVWLQLDADIRKQLKKMIDEKYVGVDDFTVHSLIWNYVMAEVSRPGETASQLYPGVNSGTWQILVLSIFLY